MVKLFLSLSGLVVCVFFGIKISSKYKKEKETIQYIINFNKNLIINLEYKKENLVTFITNYDKTNEILSCYLKQIKKDKISFNFIKNQNIKSVLENYFLLLGKSDSFSQIEYLKSYEKTFDNLLADYKKTNENKIILYPKLGVFGGLILFVLLI